MCIDTKQSTQLCPYTKWGVTTWLSWSSMETVCQLSSRRADKFASSGNVRRSNTHLLAMVWTPIHFVNFRHDDPQEFDQLYYQLHRMLDAFYPESTVTITTSYPPY